MCCAELNGRPEETVGNCPACGYSVDSHGESTEEDCCYSPAICEECGYSPCDGSC